MAPVPRPGLQHLLLTGLLLLAVGLTLWPGRRLREDRAEVLTALRAAAGPQLPAAEGAGAQEATPTARYGRENLHDLVNGAAEGYLSRGFERCSAAIYGFGGGLEVSAEAYRFAAEEGARAQLAAERPAAALPVPGLAAVSDGNVLLAVQGRDLLKLTSLTPDDRGRAALLGLLHAWTPGAKP